MTNVQLWVADGRIEIMQTVLGVRLDVEQLTGEDEDVVASVELTNAQVRMLILALSGLDPSRDSEHGR